jgi:hypothetical protein
MKRFAANLIFKYALIFAFTVLYRREAAAQLPSLITSKQFKSDSSSIENFLKRSMFIKVFVSKSKIFVGEPVMALYKFYTSVSGQAVVLKQPEFTGCSVKELNFGDAPETETLNGETYTVYIIRKVQLTPVQPGALAIGVATVTNHVEIPDAQEFISDKYDITVSNTATSVDVTSLPEKNKPEKFYGITGLFSITASVQQNKIPVDENDHLIITIRGAGNLDAINKPEIIWPSGTQHFDGNDSQHIDQNNFPISGNRIFDIPFIGKKEGSIQIPPISLSYFNTDLKSYETIKTDSIPVVFTSALAKNNEYNGIVKYDISNRKYLWIVPAIAVTVALVGFISYKRNKIQLQKKVATQPSVTPVPVFEPVVQFKYKTDFSAYWNELQNMTDIKLFFAKAKELLLRAISEKTNSQHHTETFLIAELKEKASPALCKKTFVLLELCDEKIYAPFETETDLQSHFNEVKNTIEELQAEI